MNEKASIYINEITAAQYRKLSALAAEIESKLEGMVVELVQADIPEDAKLRTLAWINRADTFRGLSYFLTPQPEWTGGDSSDPANFKLRAPHIATAR